MIGDTLLAVLLYAGKEYTLQEIIGYTLLAVLRYTGNDTLYQK